MSLPRCCFPKCHCFDPDHETPALALRTLVFQLSSDTLFLGLPFPSSRRAPVAGIYSFSILLELEEYSLTVEWNKGFERGKGFAGTSALRVRFRWELLSLKKGLFSGLPGILVLLFHSFQIARTLQEGLDSFST
ncbi:hypothetical protein Salat_3000200, partial [Sesamum alatum]